MQQLTRFVFIIFVLAACNNTANEQPVTKQEIPEKEKEMKDAITKYPDSVLLRENLIQYYQDNGTIDLALAEINKAIGKDTSDSKLWDKKAELYILQSDTLNAIKAYEKAIDIFPDPQYIMSLGWLYAKTKNANALVMANALLMAQKANAAKEALLIKGLYFSSTGDNKKALAFFDNCLALDYTFMFAYREKAIVLYDIGKYDDAITVLNKAVTLQNNFDEGYYWLGKCYEKLKKTNEAIESYKTALMYNPDYVEASDALGKLGVK